MTLLRVNKAKQTGQAAVELVMSLLLFTAMLGTLLSLSMYVYMQHTLWTAAKEGARAAAVEADLASAGTWNTGVSDVRNRVISFVSNSTGITLASNNITVNALSGSVGNRTVSVNVNYTFQNPVQIRTFINRLGGGSTTGLDTFTISSSATMRYED